MWRKMCESGLERGAGDDEPRRRPRLRAARRGARAALAVGLSAAVLSACGSDSGSGGGGGSASAPKRDTLVILDTAVAPSLDNDGAAASDPATEQALEVLRDPLIRYPTVEQDGVLVPNYRATADEFEPALAESWRRDGLTWTITLRRGALSCAGNELTADDVVYTFARAKSLSGASPVSWFLGNVSNVFDLSALDPRAPASARELRGEVEKVDRYTVRIRQHAPNDLFPRVLTIFALFPMDSVEMRKHATPDDPWAHRYTDTEDAPGFGPYCLKRWVKGREMVYEANPGYWQGEPTYKRVIVRAVPSESARVAALISGEADIVTSLTPKSLERIKSSGRADVLEWQNNRILALGINYRFAPFTDEERGRLLRQAIAYALPYDEIIRSDYLGDAKQWKGLVESTYHGYREDDRYTTDLAKARELMAQAGFPDGRGLPADSPAFTLNYVAERQTLLEPIATRIKTALAQIGIPIRLAPISQSELATRELAKFDMGMWLHDYTRPIGTDAGYAMLLWYVAKEMGGLITTENYNSKYVNDTFIKSQTTEGDERLQLLADIQERLMTDLPKVPIVELPSQLAVRKGLRGWFGQPYDLINFFYLQ